MTSLLPVAARFSEGVTGASPLLSLALVFKPTKGSLGSIRRYLAGPTLPPGISLSSTERVPSALRVKS
ncbi:hypothetical protein D3C81_2244850 [compost metagenome]